MSLELNCENHDQYFYENYFLARQPIFDRNGNTWGYELLYRNGAQKDRAEINNQEEQDFAALSVATSGFNISQENADRTTKIFLNFTEKLILEDGPRALPPAICVIEILENVRPSPQLLEKIIHLKQDGYLIAVDDFGDYPWQKEYLDFADIIKVDVLGKDPDWCRKVFEELSANRALKLAEKVENNDEYKFLRELGFDLFQGFFFARPENLKGRKISSSQTSRFKVLQTLNDPDLDPEKLVQLISSDPTITYRLLRFLNSPGFGLSMKINSVRHAVNLLGAKRLKYWLQMVVMSDMMSSGKSQELYAMALYRGKVLEELAIREQVGKVNPETMFLFGMLSLIDIMLDTPMAEVVEKLPLSEEMKAGYTDNSSPFAAYLDMMRTLEKADVDVLEIMCEETHVDMAVLAEVSIKSAIWTQQMAEHLL